MEEQRRKSKKLTHQPHITARCNTCGKRTIFKRTAYGDQRFTSYECMVCGQWLTIEGPDYDWWMGLGRR
jgi:hypothetical protein